MKELPRFSFGIGDRFAHEAEAQLSAFIKLADSGLVVAPVWNKSNREHSFVGSEPSQVRAAALKAVEALDWRHPWFVDADHVGAETIGRFLDCSDFFTIDVASSIGATPDEQAVAAFLQRHPEFSSPLEIEGVAGPVAMTPAELEAVVRKYQPACRAAAGVRDIIREARGSDAVIEVSMDETEDPQTPSQLLVILALLADEEVPLQTIAPKFTGRFNKGVDYVGDLAQFAREFEDDVAVCRYAVSRYGLPHTLKLSMHSGSDKFSLYPVIRGVLEKTGAGLHLKTAGTTWLEELIGLAEAGGDGLALVKEIYGYALDHVDELCAPYASVIDIRVDRLPALVEVEAWSGPRLASAIRHIPAHPQFNPDMRQLLHVSFKIAAKHGTRYTDLLHSNRAVVASQVTENLYERHLLPLFGGFAGSGS